MQRSASPIANLHATLLLIPFWGHDLPLSLMEIREQLGLKKSDLLRALAEAERRGELVRQGEFQWARGPRMGHCAAPSARFSQAGRVSSRIR